MALTALALNCTLKPSDGPSSSELMARQYLDALAEHDVGGSLVRVVDHDVRPGVDPDMGDGDQWPAIREQVLAADIVVIVTPTWVGQMSSVANRVLERLNAESSETGADGNPILYGTVALVGVVGNEDGAHKTIADVFQAVNDIGFTVPAQGGTYWNGEAMHSKDYNDLDEVPEAVASTTAAVARNAVHLARTLKNAKYPPYK